MAPAAARGPGAKFPFPALDKPAPPPPPPPQTMFLWMAEHLDDDKVVECGMGPVVELRRDPVNEKELNRIRQWAVTGPFDRNKNGYSGYLPGQSIVALGEASGRRWPGTHLSQLAHDYFISWSNRPGCKNVVRRVTELQGPEGPGAILAQQGAAGAGSAGAGSAGGGSAGGSAGGHEGSSAGGAREGLAGRGNER